MIPAGAKQAAKGILPNWLHPRQIARRRVLNYARGRVSCGPFKGQIYLSDPRDFVDPTILMGTYEQELHETIGKILLNPPDLFVDVGSAQGYYSIGFARLAPETRNIAFEISENAIAQLNRSAVANNVSGKIELRGACSPTALADALEGATRPLVLVDVDGYEDALLQPTAIPQLARASLIVETHDIAVPGITDELCRRFHSTHSIECIGSQPRTSADVPFWIKDRWIVQQLHEGRGGQQFWLIMEPRLFL
jgi:hypothetical protein